VYPTKVSVPEFVRLECVADETSPPTGGVPDITVIVFDVE
jgi:hypothetical protein